MAKVNIKDLKVYELKNELLERDLETSGGKAALQARLMEALEQSGEDPAYFVMASGGDRERAVEEFKTKMAANFKSLREDLAGWKEERAKNLALKMSVDTDSVKLSDNQDDKKADMSTEDESSQKLGKGDLKAKNNGQLKAEDAADSKDDKDDVKSAENGKSDSAEVKADKDAKEETDAKEEDEDAKDKKGKAKKANSVKKKPAPKKKAEEAVEEAPKKKKAVEPPVPVPAGRGIPIDHIPDVEVAISRFKMEDLKFRYNQLCRTNLIKRNKKKFKGYEFEKDTPEHKAKLEEVQKLEPKQLRTLCEKLGLDKRGAPTELASRVVGFLLLPKQASSHARGLMKERPVTDRGEATGGRPRRSAAAIVKRGYSNEEYETDPETKVRGPKVSRDELGDSDGSYNPSGSGQEADSDFDPSVGEGGAPSRRRRAPARRGSAKQSKQKGRPKHGAAGSHSASQRTRARVRTSLPSRRAAPTTKDSDPLTPASKRGLGAVAARGRKAVPPAKERRPCRPPRGKHPPPHQPAMTGKTLRGKFRGTSFFLTTGCNCGSNCPYLLKEKTVPGRNSLRGG